MTMATYIIFFHLTHQGLDHLKGSPGRIEQARKTFEDHGAKVKDVYMMMGHGQYDSMFIVDAPTDEVASQLALTLEVAGNVRSETHRAFNLEEFKKIVAGVPAQK
jgi:uncharacterized protein with GYD domain